jgi:glutamate-ammonia-ligase adenylyltransferase
MAIVGMGKLGGREMTATSDLDLIFVYATPEEATAVSDGPRPLSAPQYFARLSQRLINAITAPTSEGRLYEVDMRLRPSGKAGPIAVSATTFARYQREEAWVWEQMALTRARVIAGPAELAAEIEATIRSVLTRPRDPVALAVEVAEMRARMAEEHRPQSIWDAKHVRGGLVDIEFIAQYLQLRQAHTIPGVLSSNTREALSRLRAAGVLAADIADDLIDALDLWQTVQHRVRLNIGEVIGALEGDDAPKPLRLAVQGIAGLDFEKLVNKMHSVAERVHEHFRRIIEEPTTAGRAGVVAKD